MNKIAIVVVLFVLPLSVAAQKTLTFNQIFKGEYPSIFNPLPEIEGWVDDDHYIEVRKDSSGKPASFSVHVLTGKSTPYVAPESSEKKAPEIKNAQNITLSPDGKFAAYTRDNNLYVSELATNKETAITSDGSETVLNGYASWVYYEEILGRSSRYKAFWWSPDSRSIAYMRFDDKDVPVFPIYFADGQHGHLESERYPKAGDKNPEVKIAIASIADAKTVWMDFDEHRDQYFGTPQWTPASQLLVQWANRSQDSLIVYKMNKTRWFKNTRIHGTPIYLD